MTKDWRRLASAAVRRRAELGLTQSQVAERGPLSLDRVQAIEGARRDSYRLGTLLALERALSWEGGSVERVLEGGEPSPVRRDSPEPIGMEASRAAEEILDRILARLQQMGSDPERLRRAERVIEALDDERDAG